ncbi:MULTISPECIES: topoisomerase DNA-binding C4 zinc finger domain-containing protein [unclassified Rhizobium]|uniref:topoisomerase DNA-binding C4 zinc finger domain-containing protein n=1 Tax=unclassified Rhizobium TaxID=2613769 RepID=UPI0007EA2858|nr:MULTISPECIES: topoisomerase DNA-binding C4 zinc finger domain-containing protein [unclassified Rhizobium]ANK91545.1 protein kinase-like domain-containing protein [Rhizobium sp. N6212]ANK97578.1 protein kinase-like domain-containing protein [Rhizobium sp. N621]
MSSVTDKLFADGRELKLSNRVGKGGEGEVFSLVDIPGHAVKRYFPQIAGDRESKIRAMVGSRVSASATTVAFPEQIVTDSRGKFVGFMMRLVDKHKEIHELQTPSSRQKHFPKADYRFLVRVALNVARVFAQVHSTGCVVGDINQRGILVSETATVALIDADSFQFVHNGDRHLCVVGVPEYTPPELQGKSLKDIVRSKDHDAFGLAVCIFQILCMDRHPFSGRFRAGDMPLEKAISEFRFAYSGRNTGMEPPPGSVKLSDFPPSVRLNFEEAFAPDHVGKRPSPEMWVKSLEELEQSLRPCSKNRLHHYSRLAQDCPWCRMEATYGRPLFVNPDIASVIVGDSKADAGRGWVIDVAALLATINSCVIPTSVNISLPAIDHTLSPSAEVQQQQNSQGLLPFIRIAGLGIAAFGVFTLTLKHPSLLLSFGLIGFGLFLAFKKAEEKGSSLIARHMQTWSKIKAVVQAIQAKAPLDKAQRTKSEVLGAIEHYKSLSKAYEQVRTEYDGRRRQEQLESYLSGFPLRRARIPKLRTSDFAAMASYNFHTAFDVKTRDVQQVQGIGPVKDANLKAWVRGLEAKFQFSPTYTVEDQNKIRAKQAEIVTKQKGQDDKIKSLIAQLQAEIKAFEAWRTQNHPELITLFRELSQLECDIKAVGGAIPPKANIPPHSMQTHTTSSYQSTPAWGAGATSAASRPISGGSSACPNCGAAMRLRTARRGYRRGNKFWGCTRYPACRGTRPY